MPTAFLDKDNKTLLHTACIACMRKYENQQPSKPYRSTGTCHTMSDSQMQPQTLRSATEHFSRNIIIVLSGPWQEWASLPRPRDRHCWRQWAFLTDTDRRKAIFPLSPLFQTCLAASITLTAVTYLWFGSWRQPPSFAFILARPQVVRR
jgi:hypothetical protein